MRWSCESSTLKGYYLYLLILYYHDLLFCFDIALHQFFIFQIFTYGTGRNQSCAVVKLDNTNELLDCSHIQVSCHLIFMYVIFINHDFLLFFSLYYNTLKKEKKEYYFNELVFSYGPKIMFILISFLIICH